MKLYDYFRSSAAYRVRIALNLKGLSYERIAVNLLQGEQKEDSYKTLNPQGLVPTLVDDDKVFTQSLAICEYLEETHPEPPLLPSDPVARAQVRTLALAVACEIHPLNNSGVLKYLVEQLGASETDKLVWYHHWLREGFTSIETLLANQSGRFCHGDSPTLADVCLVPQMFNARRFKLDLTPFPTIVRIEQTCLELPAFADARPKV